MGHRRVEFVSRFDRPVADVWPIVSDTNHGNEVTAGLQPYTVEDLLQPDGSVVRRGHGRLGPFRVDWDEGFGEWVENGYIHQIRRYRNGPVKSLEVTFLLSEEDGGTRVDYAFDADWDSPLGTLLDLLGVWFKVPKELVETNERRVAALGRPEETPRPKPARL